jgi:glycosyltransferase involved in cell wall biosynthesis
MRCLFLAPMKAPDHPLPSGDRAMARLFARLLGRVGYEVELVSPFTTRTRDPSPERWQALEEGAEAELARLLGGELAQGGPVACVFTYHVYYKAPDLIGPRLARALGVPYVVAEATRAPRRAEGPYARGHELAERAIDAADLVLNLTARDREMLERYKPAGQRIADLKPFFDLADWPFAGPPQPRAPGELRLLTVAMMRPGNKLASHHQLAEALARLGRPFRLDMVGDGPTHDEVHAAFAPFGDRVRFHGMIEDRAALARLYREADLFVWPGVGEAYGAVYIEAQAHGLPCVAGAYGGVPDVIRNDETGLLTPPGDIDAYAGAIRALADDEFLRASCAMAAWHFASEERTIEVAQRILQAALDGAGIPRPAI